MTETIAILVTGGTFDKEYDELTGRLFFRETHVAEMLRLGRCNLEMDVRSLMLVDSLDMTDLHRGRILEHCAGIASRRVVITHGTDTMVETAKYLARSIHDKTIVLTGAMVPYRFGSSDGMFNLGCAIAYASTLPSGVYVAMNGRYFQHAEVRKNRILGVFEALAD